MDKSKNKLGYLTNPKELCDNKSTRLGGPFGIGQILLQKFRALVTRATPFQMV
jgi:hypothetical protein